MELTVALEEWHARIPEYRVKPGGTCALTTSCIIGKEEYPAEAVIEKDVTALMIPDSEFRQALLDSELFRQFVFQGFSRRLCAIVSRMENVALKTIDERLALQLLKGDDDSLSNITHQVLAAEIGTARICRYCRARQTPKPLKNRRLGTFCGRKRSFACAWH